MTREECRGLTAFIVILLIFSAFFVIGTGAATASTSDPEQNVCRDLPSGTQAPGSVITVSLDATVGSATYYAIDEEVPSGWTITGASDGGDYTADPGHVKWVVTSGTADKTYSYTVQIPGDASGTYAFSGGEFQMEGMSSSDLIDCDPSITVEGTSGDGTDTGDSNDLGTTTINDQETTTINDQETATVNDPDPETDDESSSASTESASNTSVKSVATTQSPDNSAEEVPASEAGSSMFAIVIGVIVIVSYKLKEN